MMSRAFVKEEDGLPDRPTPVPLPDRPNYVTPRGLELLRESLERARAAGELSQIEFLDGRIDSAIVVDPAAQAPGRVEFGATVRIAQQDGSEHTYHIVGEDEADPLHGTISWISPLAQALSGKRVGDRAVWKRPAGDIAVRILSIEF